MAIYAIETADGKVLSVGYESMRDARDDAQVSTDGGRARTFDTVEELREEYPDSWLDQYTDEQLRNPPA